MYIYIYTYIERERERDRERERERKKPGQLPTICSMYMRYMMLYQESGVATVLALEAGAFQCTSNLIIGGFLKS